MLLLFTPQVTCRQGNTGHRPFPSGPQDKVTSSESGLLKNASIKGLFQHTLQFLLLEDMRDPKTSLPNMFSSISDQKQNGLFMKSHKTYMQSLPFLPGKGFGNSNPPKCVIIFVRCQVVKSVTYLCKYNGTIYTNSDLCKPIPTVKMLSTWLTDIYYFHLFWKTALAP